MPPKAKLAPAGKKSPARRPRRDADDSDDGDGGGAVVAPKPSPKPKNGPRGKAMTAAAAPAAKRIIVRDALGDEIDITDIEVDVSRNVVPESALLQTAPILDVVVMPTSPPFSFPSWNLYGRALRCWTTITFFARTLLLSPMPPDVFCWMLLGKNNPVELARQVLRGLLEAIYPKSKQEIHEFWRALNTNKSEGEPWLLYTHSCLVHLVTIVETRKRKEARIAMEQARLLERLPSEFSQPAAAALPAPENVWRDAAIAQLDAMPRPLKWKTLTVEQRIFIIELLDESLRNNAKACEEAAAAYDAFAEVQEKDFAQERTRVLAEYDSALQAITAQGSKTSEAGKALGAILAARDAGLSSATYRLQRSLLAHDSLDISGHRAVFLGRDRFMRAFWIMPLSCPVIYVHCTDVAHSDMLALTPCRTSHPNFTLDSWTRLSSSSEAKSNIDAEINNNNAAAEQSDEDEVDDLELLLGTAKTPAAAGAAASPAAPPAIDAERWGFVPFCQVRTLLAQLDQRLPRERELSDMLTRFLPYIEATADWHSVRRPLFQKNYRNHHRFGLRLT